MEQDPVTLPPVLTGNVALQTRSACLLAVFFLLVVTGCGNHPFRQKPDHTPANGEVIKDNEGKNRMRFAVTLDKQGRPARPCVHEGSGTDYPVGPGQNYTDLSKIPWSSLGPGDTVRIHWRETPYREKLLISGRGTHEQPIRICGVPGENGKRPIISGQGAGTPSGLNHLENYFARDHDNFQGLGLIIISGNYSEKPANIVIEGLVLQHARDEYHFLNSRGEKRRYAKGAACIRIQAADNVIIRNNEIAHCGNGIFTMSQSYNEAALTRNLLIEGNYLHDNGQPESYLEHNLYIQAIGVTYQFNRLGPNTPGAEGVNLKDRSAGTVVRYNWFEGGTRVLDLVEVEDSAPWFIEQAYLESLEGMAPDPKRLAEVRATEKRYRKSYVYGNLIRHVGSTSPASNLIHYGYDNDPTLSRRGTLYFYNNTLVLLNDRNESWRLRLFDIYPYDETPGKERVEAFNNIVYVASETPGAAPSYLCFGRDSGDIHLGRNWVSPGWNDTDTISECYDHDTSPTISGTENLLETTGMESPVNLETLMPKENPAIHEIQPLPAALLNTHPVKYQYVKDRKGAPRPTQNTLGAIELP